MKKYYFKAEKLRVGYGKQPLIENIEICLEKGEILYELYYRFSLCDGNLSPYDSIQGIKLSDERH